MSEPVPITDVPAWLDQQGSLRRDVIAALGELLSGVTAVEAAGAGDSERAFTAKHLGVPSGFGYTVVEERDLSSVSAVTTAMALAEWITEHSAPVGPGRHNDPPVWTTSDIANVTYRHPLLLRGAFPAGTLDPNVPIVIAIDARPNFGKPTVTAVVRSADQPAAVAALDALDDRGAALNPFRGRICRATSAGIGLTLSVIDPPASLSRTTAVHEDAVWRELDLSISAVRDRHEQLAAAGVSPKRAAMLIGRPGTGKSLLSMVIAKELVAEGFTAFIVDASAGERLLTAVMEEAARLQPALVVLEDVDLFVRSRSVGCSGLAELLGGMDIRQEARILTIASSNDISTMDPAALRTGRFSSLIEINPPTLEAAARILSLAVAGLPGGGDGVDTAAVARALPPNTSASDLVEIATRATLGSPDGSVTTEGLLCEIGQGRWRPELPAGTYL